ncbi:MAG: DUF937 domain-containing protein [Gemmatimonadota bacterium]
MSDRSSPPDRVSGCVRVEGSDSRLGGATASRTERRSRGYVSGTRSKFLQTERGVAAAIPVLLGGLARNANASPDGAESLNHALERDHDGSVLDNLGDLLGAAESAFGAGDSGGSGGGLGELAGALAGALGGQAFGDAATPSGSAVKVLDGAGILEHVLGGRRRTVERGIGQASGLDVSQIAKLLPLLAPIVMAALGKLKRKEGLDAGGLAGDDVLGSLFG